MLDKKKHKKPRKSKSHEVDKVQSYSGRGAYIKMLEDGIYIIFLDDGSFFAASSDSFSAKMKIKEENMELISLQ